MQTKDTTRTEASAKPKPKLENTRNVYEKRLWENNYDGYEQDFVQVHEETMKNMN